MAYISSSAYDLEYRYDGDDAWYTVKVVASEGGEKLTVKYLNFLDSSDITFRADQFATAEEIDELISRFRLVSRQIQAGECDKITEGMIVSASYSFRPDDRRFYDAVVEAVHHEKHSFTSGEEECLCTFVLFWQHGPNVGNLTSSGIESICLIQQAAQIDPKMFHFSMVAKKRIASELLKSTNALKHDVRVSKGPLCNEENNWSSVKKELGFQVMENSSKFHGRIRKSNSETGFHYFVLIENLEKDLSPSAIGEFIYKQTSISSQVYVFPSQPSEPYARGAIVLECKEDFEKIYDLLNSSSQLVVSAKGRPWVVTEKASRIGMFQTMLGSFKKTYLNSHFFSHTTCVRSTHGQLFSFNKFPNVAGAFVELKGVIKTQMNQILQDKWSCLCHLQKFRHHCLALKWTGLGTPPAPLLQWFLIRYT